MAVGISGNAVVVKKINTSLIRETLKKERQATTHRLAELCGVSIVTVSSILRELMNDGEVFEDLRLPSSGGRPARTYRYNGEFRHGIIIYSREVRGKDCFFIRVINLFGEILAAEKFMPGKINIRCFEKPLDRLMKSYSRLSMLGFSLPGVEQGGIMAETDYAGLDRQPLTEYYRKHYGIPVVFENDVNAALLGFCGRHSLDSSGGIVYIYFPEKYPPGAGIVINGKLIRGWKNSAGEIKKLPLGIEWNRVNYASPAQVRSIISKIILSIIPVINPELVVLQAEFLTAGDFKKIQDTVTREAGEQSPGIHRSDDFSADLERGISGLTLALSGSKITLHKEA